MATIYRFIIEQKQSGGSGGSGRKPRDNSATTKGAAKKGKQVSLFGGERGGVEHNRKMRAINPLINRMTGGAWEKGMRIGRAGLGMAKNVQEKGAKGVFAGPALAIIIAFAITMLMKWLEWEQQKASRLNAQNYKQLENGIGAVHGQYKVSTNILTGRHTYNQNK